MVKKKSLYIKKVLYFLLIKVNQRGVFQWGERQLQTKELYNYHTFSDSVEYNFVNKKNINAADIAFNFSGLIYIQSFNIFHDFY